MKQILAMLLAAALALTLAGCGSAGGAPAIPAETAAPTEPSIPEANEPKIALITDGTPLDDGSINQACWQGMERWCGSRSIAYTHYQPAEPSADARVVAIAKSIAEGAGTVILPGRFFGEALDEVMDAYPEIRFIAIDVSPDDLTGDPAPNVACLTFAQEQAGFLAGYAAVREGYTRLGFAGTASAPCSGHGFVQGADAAAAELGVDIQIHYAPAGIADTAETWYKDGAEVIFACGSELYTPVLEAARNHGGKVICSDADLSAIAPENFLAFTGKNYQAVTELLLEALDNGKWETYGGAFTRFSLADGSFLDLSAASWTMEQFTAEDYEAVKARIADGSITVTEHAKTLPAVSEWTTVIETD